MSDLINRLRGIYTLPINDGCGPIDGKDTFTRTFDVSPINKEAANRIESLERKVEMLERHKAVGDASCHVVIEAGIVPGVSYLCRCEECRIVAKSMDEAGYMDRIKDRWWEEPNVSDGGVRQGEQGMAD